MQDFSMFDIAVIAITLLLGLKGLFRGLIKEAFGLIGIVGGIFVASRASKEIGELVAPVLALESESSIKLLGFIVGLVGFWIIVYLIGMILSKISSMSGLGIFDRILGFLFGAGKVFLILSIIIYAISQVTAFKEKLEKNFANTMTYPILIKTGAYIIKLDTAGLTSKIEKNVDGAVKSSKEAIEDMTKEAIEKKVNEVVKEQEKAIEETKKEIEKKVEEVVKQKVEQTQQAEQTTQESTNK